MSFLKIKDPKKRDLIVEEFLKTKKNIQYSFITERLGDISAQRELSKFFKPSLKLTPLLQARPYTNNIQITRSAIS